MYLAIVLDEESRIFLRGQVDAPSYEVLCHHVTICMGSDKKGKYPFTVGEVITCIIDAVGLTTVGDLPAKDRNKLSPDLDDCQVVSICIRVVLPDGKFTKNSSPHVTCAVDRNIGGKPMHSNHSSWNETVHKGRELKGVVTLCE
jgi:hypothetical protein